LIRQKKKTFPDKPHARRAVPWAVRKSNIFDDSGLKKIVRESVLSPRNLGGPRGEQNPE